MTTSAQKSGKGEKREGGKKKGLRRKEGDVVRSSTCPGKKEGEGSTICEREKKKEHVAMSLHNHGKFSMVGSRAAPARGKALGVEGGEGQSYSINVKERATQYCSSFIEKKGKGGRRKKRSISSLLRKRKNRAN